VFGYLHPASNPDITTSLRKWHAGDAQALTDVTSATYAQLRRMAANYLRRERSGHTLDPTALVHEVYLQLPDLQAIGWQNRGHFLAAVAQMMRHVLIGHARKRATLKRGGAVEFEAREAPQDRLDLLSLHVALDKLAEQFPRQAQVVELKFFGGFSSSEIADILSACGSASSLRTVERDWRLARAWLHREIASSSPE
jgi:RNA polymerase sigma-70 factor (ECF subfamily)